MFGGGATLRSEEEKLSLKERSKVEEEQQRPSKSYWSRQDGRYHRHTPKPTKTVLVGG